jgi:DNA polymerase I-like protein with 3'-5' exonuclease and polymerase domains
VIAESVVLTERGLDAALSRLTAEDAFAVDVETVGERRGQPAYNEATWVSLATHGFACTIPMGHPNGSTLLAPGANRKDADGVKRWHPPVFDAPPQQLPRELVMDRLAPLLTSREHRKIAHNASFDFASLTKYLPEAPPPPYADTIVAFWLVDENAPSKGLKFLVKGRYGVTYDTDKTGAKIEEQGFAKAAAYGLRDVRYDWLLWRTLEPMLEAEEVRSVFDMEMDVLEVLIPMRLTGAHVDVESLRDLEGDLAVQLDEARKKVYAAAGREFNIGSVPQKQNLLYGPAEEGGQGLSPRKLTETGGMSTDAEALEPHRDNPLAAALLAHAEVDKLQSTYVHGYLGTDKKLGAVINGRIHTDFVQYGTVTGRFSSREPNLQNVPRPGSELGKRVRGLFSATPGYKLLVGDYGQIELRVLAHFIGHGGLYDGFHAGIDAHTATAAAIFGVPFEDVTKDQRQVSKGVNFAVIYGAGPVKVASMSGTTVKEAKGFMATHQQAFPEIYSFKERVIASCRSREGNYIRTLLGRKRRLPGIRSRDGGTRSMAERQCFNSLIQGSAGDLIKLAMVRTHKRLPEGARLVLTVHDELVVEAPVEIVDAAKAALTEALLGAGIQELIKVPLTSDIVVCDRWSEAK